MGLIHDDDALITVDLHRLMACRADSLCLWLCPVFAGLCDENQVKHLLSQARSLKLELTNMKYIAP